MCRSQDDMPRPSPFHYGRDGDTGVQEHLCSLQENGIPYHPRGLAGEGRGENRQEPLHGEDVCQWGLVTTDTAGVRRVVRGIRPPDWS